MSISALEILTELRTLGVELWVDGERLRFRAPAGVLTADLRERLLKHRSEVMALLRSAGHSGPEERIERAPRDREHLPLSYSQERMWFLSQLEADSSRYRYVEAEAFRIRGPVDLTALRDALTEIVRRHENLRTVFPTVDGQPVQVVQPARPVDVRLVDASTCPATDWESRIAEAIRHERTQVFDLAAGPLLRVVLLRLDTEQHVLVVVMHHILGDAWSRIVLGRELAVLYHAFTHGEPSPLPELPIQYADYAHWERHRLQGDRLAGLLDHWRRRLDGAPMLALPGERGEGDRAPESDRSAPVSEELPVRIGPELTAALRTLGVQAHASLFMTLTAAFATLLHRYGDQRDISLGTEVANRAHPDTESLIGLLVNQLVLRIDLSGDPSFRELLHRVRAVAVDAFAHQELPFEQLVEALQPERRVGHQPLFRAGLSLENAQPAPPALDGVEIERIRLDYGALYDLFLFLTEEPDRVEGTLIYDPARVDGAVIARLLDNFGCLLRSLVADPDRPISELDLLSLPERRDVLERWNDTGGPSVDVTAVHHQFERQAGRTPDRTAVAHAGVELTYRQLNEAANRLAHRLLADGLRSEELVGIFLAPSIERIVCTYAILKAGGAIVFLDPQYPQNRLAQMLDEARLTRLFTTRDLGAALPPNDVVRIHVDAEPSDGPGPVHDSDVPVHVDQLLYAIFTSGTTGLPKRIGFTHRAFANLLAWQADQPGLAGPATTLQFSTFGFCVSFQEIFSTLSSGGRLVLAPTEARIEPESLVELLRREQVQRLYLPFAALKMLAQSACHNGTYPTDLQAVVTAGEQLQVTDELRTLFEHLPSASLHNQYGASETHVVTSYVLGGPPARWPTLAPIGRPNRNNRIYLLDRHLRPVPVGTPGDLYVAGTGLLRGYLDDPQLTAAKVVADPFSSEPGSRMYRTGDLAVWLSDGTLRHLGRVDDQVKVRGFRIELGDIEASLRRRPGVRDVAVAVRGSGPTGHRVVAYLVLDDAVLTVDALWAQIERDLPAHMIPAAMIVLPDLPVNANGKLDRDRLPEPGPEAHRRPPAVPFVAPRTPLERQLADVVAAVLGLPEIGINDDFFDRGGHSLLATQAVLRIRDTLGVELPVRAFFDGPTVAELAVRLVQAQLGAVGKATAVAAPTPTGDREWWPLSYPQERLWFMEQAVPGNSAYNLMEAVRIEGALQVATAERALRRLIDRQQALSTVIRTGPDGEGTQAVTGLDDWRLPVRDLSAVPDDRRRAALHGCMTEEADRPFDLAHGPLFRMLLCRMGHREHVLVITMHHLIADGWSFAVLMEEFAELYWAELSDRPAALAPLPIQYRDFATWQREQLTGPALDDLLGYWRRTLAGAPSAIELTSSPGRGAGRTLRGAHLAFTVPDEVAEPLARAARAAGATRFMTTLAAFLLVLRHRCGQEDLVVGTDVANRTVPGTDRLVGLFVNQVVLRVDCSGNPAFDELLSRVRSTAVDAFAHQELPFQTLVADLAQPRRLDRNPLFNVLFVVQDSALARWNVPGLTLTAQTLDAPSGSTAFDLSVHLFDTDDGLNGVMRYSTDLFDAATMHDLVADFQAVLRAASAAPRMSVQEISAEIDRDRARRQAEISTELRAASVRALRTARRKGIGQPTARPDGDQQ